MAQVFPRCTRSLSVSDRFRNHLPAIQPTHTAPARMLTRLRRCLGLQIALPAQLLPLTWRSSTKLDRRTSGETFHFSVPLPFGYGPSSPIPSAKLLKDLRHRPCFSNPASRCLPFAARPVLVARATSVAVLVQRSLPTSDYARGREPEVALPLRTAVVQDAVIPSSCISIS